MASGWNDVCWWKSVLGHAAEAMPACERGVDLEPKNGHIRDSRGLARALTGDYQGAIEDFQAYVEWSREMESFQTSGMGNDYQESRLKREKWIEELKAGQNPFDEATLKQLLKEPCTCKPEPKWV